MCVTIEEIKQKYNKVSSNIHRRILKYNDYFIDFLICVTLIFRQLDYQRATLEEKWGWHGVARSGASCLRSYRAIIPLPKLVWARSRVASRFLHFFLKHNREKC